MTIQQIFNTSAELDYPTVLPTLDLDFANSKTLDPRITFTRSSGGSYVGADGLIKYAGVNEPRFNHDPVTGESLGLLVEEQRTNLIFSSALPPRQNGLRMTYATGPSIVRPDGTTGVVNQLTTDTFGSDSYTRFTNNVMGGTANTLYAGSMWIRTSTGTADINIKVNQATLSYSNGTFYNVTTNWQRITDTGSSPDTNLFIDLTTGSALPAGTIFYIWGAQIEAGAFPTSYIPTTTAAVTRSADVASISGANLTSWYNYSEGTFYGEVNFNSTLKNLFSTIIGVNGNGNNGIMSAAYGTSAYPNKVTAGLVNFNSLNWFPVGKNERLFTKLYRLGSFGGSPAIYDGPYPYIFHLGYNPGNPVYLNGNIKRLTFWPKRFPDAQLKSLSTY